MKSSEQAKNVLQKIYHFFKADKGNSKKLDYDEIHKEFPELDAEQIKALCGHLEEKGYITINPDPVFPDIRITDIGVKFHESNP